MTERERRFLEKSWAKPFGERIFPLIDETKFEVVYCSDNGRPNTPANVVVGSLLLKELTHMTDEEMLEAIILDARYQYALHLTSFDEIPFSDRTVSRFRERLYNYELETGRDLLKEEIERLAGEFTEMLNINGSLQRMDSLMVSSSCKDMGRLELIYTCVSNLVKALVKSGGAGLLPEHLQQYTKENRNAYCYRLQQEEVQTRLEAVTTDAFLLYELAAAGLSGADEFRLLERLLSDQTEDGKLKPGSRIRPDSLQNPSDEDATFRRKAGKGYHGYVANVVESCGENGNIITQYDYDVNLCSDTELGERAIENLGPQERKTVLVTDGAYASDDNFEAAAANNIELVPTALTGQEPLKIINDFTIENDTIKSCPAGHAPNDCAYNEEKEAYRAHFDKETCENCPHREECPVIMQKKRALVKLTQSSINRAAYAEKLPTEEYKEHSKKRNGVEGVPSVLRRRYGIDRMPVRGLLHSKMWFGFKIGAMNIKRVIAAALNPAFSSTLGDVFARMCSVLKVNPGVRLSPVLLHLLMGF
jgi:hypothetical protein